MTVATLSFLPMILAAWLGATLKQPLCRELSASLGAWAGWVMPFE